MKQKKTQCIVCESSNLGLLFTTEKLKVAYFKCNNCAAVFAPVMPKTNYVKWRRSEGYSNIEGYLKSVYSRIVRDVKKYKRRGKFLEIGSSVGYMLELFQNAGFEVEGVEPSNFAVKFARKKKLRVFQGYFEKLNLGESRYDVVVMNHVLEHITTPNHFLTKVRKVLKPKGIIVICLPNFGSLEAQMFGRDWRYLMEEEHVLQFTPQTLRFLLEKNGFKILDCRTTGPLTEFGSFKEEIIRCFKNDRKRLVYYIVETIPSIIQSVLGRDLSIQIVGEKN